MRTQQIDEIYHQKNGERTGKSTVTTLHVETIQCTSCREN